jgi:hypothetical protein
MKISTDANLIPEEPDAAYLRYENWACPGLWGLRGGNFPVLPGEKFYHKPPEHHELVV